MAELQARLALEEQREEEKGKDVLSLKHRLSEAESARDSLKKEVSETSRLPSSAA